jgi:hypothetical protein
MALPGNKQQEGRDKTAGSCQVYGRMSHVAARFVLCALFLILDMGDLGICFCLLFAVRLSAAHNS